MVPLRGNSFQAPPSPRPSRHNRPFRNWGRSLVRQPVGWRWLGTNGGHNDPATCDNHYPAEYLTAIYSAEFDRTRTQAIPWGTINPSEALYAADNARFQRKGAADDVLRVDTSDDPDLDQLIATFADALRTS